jgi:hypothetical protein
MPLVAASRVQLAPLPVGTPAFAHDVGEGWAWRNASLPGLAKSSRNSSGSDLAPFRHHNYPSAFCLPPSKRSVPNTLLRGAVRFRP